MPHTPPDGAVNAGHLCAEAADALHQGRFGDAARLARRAIDLDGVVAEPWIHLAHAAIGLHETGTALIASHEAMQRAPSDATAHHAAACAARSAQESVLAETHLRIAVQLEPTRAEYLIELGDLLRRSGRAGDAEQAYDAALLQRPEHPDALIGAMRCATARRDEAAAMALAEHLLAGDGDDGAVVVAAADELLAAGQHERVVALTRAAIDEGPDRRQQVIANLWALRAEALDALGRHDQAWAASVQANRLQATTYDHDATERRFAAIRRRFPAAAFDGPEAPVPAGAPLPVFIAGMPRSGTSLTEQILDSHELAAGAGELNLMRRVVRRLASQKAYPACLDGLDDATVATLAGFARRELARAAGGARVVVEKTPDNGVYLGLIRMLLPEARIIWCRRDPMDTCLSCWFQVFSGGHAYACDLEHLGAYHRAYDTLMTHWQRSGVLPMHVVEYERLTENPEPCVGELLSFAGLDWSDRCMAFHDNPREVQTASRRQVRRPLYRSSVGRHQRYDRHLAPLRRTLVPSCEQGAVAGAEPGVEID